MTRQTIKEKTLSKISRLCALALSAGAAAALMSSAGGVAAAETVPGWTGPAGTTGWLHNSTIINSPNLTAESKIWQTFGQTAPGGTVGVRARLFKSGALCEAVDYQYNYYPETSWAVRTTQTCGTGSYNSHGFVAVWNASSSSYGEYLTFPSNPVNWTAPGARSSGGPTITSEQQRGGVNTKGQTFGSADVESEQEPDLILAIGDGGSVGYVRAEDLNAGIADDPVEALTQDQQDRPIPLWDKEGTNQVGTFVVH